MNEENWASLIGTISFPIVVTMYLLVRVERTLKELASAIQALCEKLS